jgi:hypothetical protein
VSQSPYGVFKPVQTRAEEGVDAAVILDCIRVLSPPCSAARIRLEFIPMAAQQKLPSSKSTEIFKAQS